ncbi:MAG: peptidase M14, partial [Thermoproteota archaeon]
MTQDPSFIYSLHNAGFGGVYYYVSKEMPLLYPIYQYMAYMQDLPLSLGEPEVPYAVKLADAVYYLPSTRDRYDYLEKHSDKDPFEIIRSGTSSVDYARRVNLDVSELVCEVPYYY